mgnify:CR=1 FL=1
MLTDILKGNHDLPHTAPAAAYPGKRHAGRRKTGTTNASRDTWFCGYTRYYTTAVWVGYEIPRDMPGVYGSTYAGKIWKKYYGQNPHGPAAPGLGAAGDCGAAGR